MDLRPSAAPAMSLDAALWKHVVQSIDQAIRIVKPAARKPLYSHRLIVAMYLWSVLHDRCLSWACDKSHYGALFRPRKLPSVSQFTRRTKTWVFDAILKQTHTLLAACPLASQLGYLDGKPLAVSPVSKDPDAACGKISGGYAKGYKLHAFVTEQRRIAAWSCQPLNVAEQSVAMKLCEHLPAMPPDALVLADSNYDSHLLHKKLAREAELALLTPLKGQKRVKEKGHHPVTLRQMGPERRAVVKLWKEQPSTARLVLKSRSNIEGVFSVLSLACGLDRLPGFVRRLERVRRWVGAKIILYHARLIAKEQRAAP